MRALNKQYFCLEQMRHKRALNKKIVRRVNPLCSSTSTTCHLLIKLYMISKYVLKYTKKN